MPHVADDAFLKHVRVTARKRARFAELRDGVALVQILAQKQRIDLRRVAAHDDILIVVREDLGLDEVARAEQVADPSHGLRARFLHAEMRGDLVEFEAFQFARRHVVEHAEQKRVHDVAAVDFKFRVLDRALGDLHARLPRAERGAVAPEFQRHAGDAGARRELRQRRAKNIVAFEHVGVAFADGLDEFLENLRFGSGEFQLPASVVAKLHGLQRVVGGSHDRQLEAVESDRSATP